MFNNNNNSYLNTNNNNNNNNQKIKMIESNIEQLKKNYFEILEKYNNSLIINEKNYYKNSLEIITKNIQEKNDELN